MNIKLKGLVLGTALSALAFSACETTSNTNVNVNKVNSNTAVVVNDNTNVGNMNVAAKDDNWNANITKEEYEKNKESYANRAEKAGDKVGQGAEDAWLWTKTRASLATTNDLRESTINVDVDNAVVTLRGTVANKEQSTKAESVAKGIDGVKSVKNDLKVAPADSMTNTSSNSSSTTNSNANMKK